MICCFLALQPGAAEGACPPPSTAVCPSGTTLDVAADRCEGDFHACLPGYAYSTSSSQCEASAPATTSSATCPAGSSFNAFFGKCETANLSPCPSGYTYNGYSDKCEIPATFTPAASCPEGYAFDATLDKCLGAPDSACTQGGYWGYYEQTCASADPLPGFGWDDETGLYIGPWACPPAYSVNTWDGSCSGPMVTASCPAGSTINARTNKCEAAAAAVCAAGQTYNHSTTQCEFAPLVSADASTCPPGHVLVADTNVCAGGMNSACPQGGSYGYYEEGCTSPDPLPGFGWDPETLQYVGPWSCPAGFGLEIGTGSCSGAACPAGQVYDSATLACEAPAPVAASTLTCPAGSSFDPFYGKCEAANLSPCASGHTYNGYSDKCEIPATFTPADSCPEGYLFNGLDCVGAPSSSCTQGGTWGYYEQTCTSADPLPGFGWDNETGLYIGPWACPPAYSVNTWDGSCSGPMVTASCPAGTTINATTSKCEAAAAPACAAGQTYNNSTTQCDFAPQVSPVAPTCPPGYILDVGTHVCAGVLNSACPQGGSYGYYEEGCTSPDPLPGFGWDPETLQYVGPWSCPAGFGLQIGTGSCSGAACQAGSAFNAATSSCQLSGCPEGTVKSDSLCIAAAVCQ
ncbi:hypothetical protein [Anaeromyxobacter sp. Fw109-5]|uniref:hypothetical protein n=1 Tax=Anaeromyxobacter sp. (strain Fw109-5) TaxID=404589 RepID=UPI00117FCB25|nr:hypothetical protein [Anaeromyxobacter sp. Fw109-5]